MEASSIITQASRDDEHLKSFVPDKAPGDNGEYHPTRTEFTLFTTTVCAQSFCYAHFTCTLWRPPIAVLVEISVRYKHSCILMNFRLYSLLAFSLMWWPMNSHHLNISCHCPVCTSIVIFPPVLTFGLPRKNKRCCTRLTSLLIKLADGCRFPFEQYSI